MEMMERNLDEASVKLDKMRKETMCRDKTCESEKICGRSHLLRKRKTEQCKYYNVGMCSKSAEDCPYQHDPAVKLKVWEDKNKEKKSFEKIRKEEKAKLKKSDEDVNSQSSNSSQTSGTDNGKGEKDKELNSKKQEVPKKKSLIEKQKLKRLKQKERRAAKGKGKGKSYKGGANKFEDEEDESDEEMETEEEVKKTKVFQNQGPAYPTGVKAGPESNQPFQNQIPSPSMMHMPPTMTSMTNMQGLHVPMPHFGTQQGPGYSFNHQEAARSQFQASPNFTQGGLDQSGAQNQQMINAFQAQQMSHFQHAEMLRRELTNVQNQIQMTQMSAPGSLELRDLSMKENHLRQEMMRRGLIPQ